MAQDKLDVARVQADVERERQSRRCRIQGFDLHARHCHHAAGAAAESYAGLSSASPQRSR